MNITLIGNPGSGKSFVGRKVADKANLNFLDIDVIIESKYETKLQNVLNTVGEKLFLREEEIQILSLGNIKNTLLSPGGSVVYSSKAMDYLGKVSKIIYLNVPFGEIQPRVDTLSRGIVGLREDGFEELFLERDLLCRKYADIIVDGSGDADVVVDRILCIIM